MQELLDRAKPSLILEEQGKKITFKLYQPWKRYGSILPVMTAINIVTSSLSIAKL